MAPPETPAAGYSKRSLAGKLGLKPNQRAVILNAPAGYLAALGILPAGVSVSDHLAGEADFIHYFATTRAELAQQLLALKAALRKSGLLWVSWPKQTAPLAARLATDLDGNVVRELGLAVGLVDVKVAAIDPTWSALKFVYRKADRGNTTIERG